MISDAEILHRLFRRLVFTATVAVLVSLGMPDRPPVNLAQVPHFETVDSVP